MLSIIEIKERSRFMKKHHGRGSSHFDPSQPRNAQGEWTVGGAIASALGLEPTPAQKERMRGMLKEIHDEHKQLAAAAQSGKIGQPDLDRLNKINSFALKNKEMLKKLK